MDREVKISLIWAPVVVIFIISVFFIGHKDCARVRELCKEALKTENQQAIVQLCKP